jgi:molecular chaperone DnaK
MRKDAELNAEEDKKKRGLADARNDADALVFNLDKQLREHDAKIPDATKKTVNEKLNELRELLKDENATAEKLKKTTEETAMAAQEIGKLIYEQAQKDNAKSEGDKKDGIVDAEVVDEKKE